MGSGMDTVIAFPVERTKKTGAAGTRLAQIVIFPGVRIERFPPKPVKTAPIKRRPRQAASPAPAESTSETA